MTPRPLDQAHLWRADPGARSPSWYAVDNTATVDAALVDDLEQRAQTAGANARACLHQGPEDGLHEMVIAQHQKTFFPPKRHFHKAKSFLVLRGELAVFTFTDDGTPRDAYLLSPGGIMACRIGIGVYHMDMPLTPLAVHFESTLGPFLGPGDRELAPWGFDVADDVGRERFAAMLRRHLGRTA